MPELPEVETIRLDLSKHLPGQTVTALEVLRSSVLLDEVSALSSALVGATIIAVRRQGKILIIEFDNERSLLVHLRMTGQLLLGDESAEVRHARVIFRLSGGGLLTYADCRMFGKLSLEPTGTLATSPRLAKLGPDALARIASRHLRQAAERRRIPIKCLLLDQSVIAGVGNIYASEICYAAKVSPERPANALSSDELRKIAQAMRRILRAAIQARGTTISDYRTGLGETGGYRFSLRVYGRGGKACRRRGCSGTIRRCVQQQRSSFYCPECQI